MKFCTDNWNWQCHYTIDTDSAITQYV